MLTQEVQFVDVVSQVAQGESQAAHVPFFMTSPVGQLLTHWPFHNAVLGAQDVQLEAVPLHVEQTELQASHVLVALLLTETLSGQEVTHPVRYKYLPATQDRQAV